MTGEWGGGGGKARLKFEQILCFLFLKGDTIIAFLNDPFPQKNALALNKVINENYS